MGLGVDFRWDERFWGVGKGVWALSCGTGWDSRSWGKSEMINQKVHLAVVYPGQAARRYRKIWTGPVRTERDKRRGPL